MDQELTTTIENSVNKIPEKKYTKRKHRRRSRRSYLKMFFLLLLSFVLTFFIKIPSVSRYVHFGDCLIYLAACTLGPTAAAVVGGIGHFFAEFLGGVPYSNYAIYTLIIKVFMGFAMGKIVYRHVELLNLIVAGISSLFILIIGYSIADLILHDPAFAPYSMLTSGIQWLMGTSAFLVMLPFVFFSQKRSRRR